MADGLGLAAGLSGSKKPRFCNRCWQVLGSTDKSCASSGGESARMGFRFDRSVNRDCDGSGATFHMSCAELGRAGGDNGHRGSDRCEERD